jgi:enoyl-CoA hydratase/carnithine racemase
MPDEALLVTVDGGVAVLTLNRPDRLNVFSGGMGALLSQAYRQCDGDDAIRAVVLTGAGRGFCAGADMTPDQDTFSAVGTGFSASPVDPPAWEVRKPVIAAINGPAIGIGFTLAMQCDIRIVAKDAKLAIPQVRRGVLGDAFSHWTVPHTTSIAVAADIMLTGRTFLGAEALQLGLASRAVPADEVLPTAMTIARDIADNCSPLSVALSKRLLWKDADRATVGHLEDAYHRVTMGAPDAREGPLAWMERRTPVWQSSVNASWDDAVVNDARAD